MVIRRKARAAGAYAQERYERGLRRYRSRARPIFVAIFGPLIVAGLVVLFVNRNLLSWLAGAMTGVLVGAWLVMRDEPPAYLESWREGAEGERKTARVLEPLERSGLRVVHDVKARYGNYDHIAVGRAGVFLLETKNLAGIVELRDGVPHVRRRLDPDADSPLDKIRPRALAAAASLKEDIARRTGHHLWVQAVVVLWSEFPEGLVDDGKCVFVHGSQLPAWIEARPKRLTQAGADDIAFAIADIASQEVTGVGTPSTQAANAS